MIPDRQVFLDNVCYTPLVFGRVNKKLQVNLSNVEIKTLVEQIIRNKTTTIVKNGKNYYLQNNDIELVINSFNYRLITINKIK
ncbi:DUF3781 domain-containing protein [Companilactobacillus zhachilii]|uniref:DUF3781 domain-containing protein n=1 Tax=Companilactobacillus zhachilii TaxID=2304606 RepID=UPI001923DDE4|nr:DUF3781 domain-containing protein [Companilactobacillus zhachilii]MBL3530567.1 DUF3781 domain-containing protein [Companilactobacillus zhachilii]